MFTPVRTLAALLLTGLLAAGPLHAAEPYKTSFAPTATRIESGHSGHSSIPTLYFWPKENLAVNVFGINGANAALQLLTSGQVDFINLDVVALLAAQAKGMKIQGVYVHTRKPISRLVVQKKSGITDLKQLKGKTVGQPVADGVIPYFTGLFAEAGLDLKKDLKTIVTGSGAPAQIAFERGDIVAWMAGDTNIAPLENRGMEFTEFKPSYYDKLLGTAVVTRMDMIEKRPDVVIGVARGVAQGVVFGLANPEAAIRVHWKVYPQTKPQGADDAALMKDAKHVFNARFQRYALESGQLYGDAEIAQFALMADQLKSLGVLPANYDGKDAFTKRFIPEINKFDREAVIAMAKAWKQ
jgi:NitT/TauT family transport system substrate-binding protein